MAVIKYLALKNAKDLDKLRDTAADKDVGLWQSLVERQEELQAMWMILTNRLRKMRTNFQTIFGNYRKFIFVQCYLAANEFIKKTLLFDLVNVSDFECGIIVWSYNSKKGPLLDKSPHSNIFSFSESVLPLVSQKKSLNELLLGKIFQSPLKGALFPVLLL